MISPFLVEVLDAVEQCEAQLLVWGVVDGRLSRDELEALIDPLLDRALERGMDDYLGAGEVIDALMERGLLFDTDSIPYAGYRSRMAETVRLVFRLRQLFPKHSGVDGWQSAPTLVADYRFAWRRRRYPRREIAVSELLDQVGNLIGDEVVEQALAALLEGKGEEFQLAGFQCRATSRILEDLTGRRYSGTLVSAGTGSGKTLAFYLPAMARLGATLAGNPGERPWVKILAIYPRTELLRDQFAEIYGEARRLDGFLVGRGSRKIRIGALFGATPKNAADFVRRERQGQSPLSGWRRTHRGYVCGFMGCPSSGCEGELVWSHEDLGQERETLVCSSCSHRIADDELLLTRQSLARNPPDILFTTTEMLNQRLSDSYLGHLFGLRPKAYKAPEMVLLDEVHTYGGTHGAQVGYLLRRWRNLVRSPVSFVGLSATLRDGVRFFASLVGLQEYQVEELAPRPTEMTAEGAEYLLALRGDPVSRVSLLSSTIQTAMLLSRALDHSDGTPSGGLYGSRIFAFTDDIDVTNRLYHNLLDAEGRNGRGDPDRQRHPQGGLAVLRQPMPSGTRERFGQNWHMPVSLGHHLDERKRIGRTSSQDPGVARNMDIIVATASLEVGFNDPGVGAVIQHKAPRDPAQFLQRKGRAGRPRGMRPWTVVVLSDYGRDRLSYQGYEQLFDPELSVRHLPLSSRYIQKMQAVYTLIDYLATKLGSPVRKGSVWMDLAGPDTYSSDRPRQNALVPLLASILKDSNALDEFANYLQDALGLSSSQVNSLLWGYPRPLLTTVIPTALRRLSSNWRSGLDKVSDLATFNSPLPEFAPPNLFSDLNLPEVQMVIPPLWQGEAETVQTMPINQALKEFAPGRVSRRFGITQRYERHWVGNGLPDIPEQGIELKDFYDTDLQGDWEICRNGTVESLPVHRPVAIRVVSPSREIMDTSNAILEWQTQIVATIHGVTLEPPAGSPWCSLITVIEGFRHADHRAVEIRRFSTGSNAEIRVQGDEGRRVHFTFMEQGQEVALGYALSVDALRFELELPDCLWPQVAASELQARAVRTDCYFEAAKSGEELGVVENPFAREWLATIYFSALTQEALGHQVELETADEAIAAGTATVGLKQVLGTLFQSSFVIDEDGGDDGQPGSSGQDQDQDRLRRDLEMLLDQPEVLTALRQLGRLLWMPIDETWEPLLRRRFVATVAAAAYEAIGDLCPDLDSQGLVVDIDPGARTPGDLFEEEDGLTEFWISETTPGGSGAIEAIMARFVEDPRRFFSLLTAALHPNEHTLSDYQFQGLLKALAGAERDSDLVAVVEAFRHAKDNNAMESAFAGFRGQLRRREFVLFHGFLSAVSNRVLRPGSTSESDAFLLHALELWMNEEQRLGVELDPRTIAYHLSQNDGIEKAMVAAGVPIPSDNRLSWRFNVIYGLLWRRGREIRRLGLEPYNPFCPLPAAEPFLVSDFLESELPRLSVQDTNWREQALARLAEFGAVTLSAPPGHKALLASALRFFATNPVESDYLTVFARVTALRQVAGSHEVDLEVEEVLL